LFLNVQHDADFWRRGKGQFKPTVPIPNLYAPKWVASGDYDGDGTSDLVYSTGGNDVDIRMSRLFAIQASEVVQIRRTEFRVTSQAKVREVLRSQDEECLGTLQYSQANLVASQLAKLGRA
jgi:hypothetical protein